MKKHDGAMVDELFNKDIAKTDTSTLFEQYRLYIESMDKISDRRYQANTFFLTVNTILVTTLTGFISLTKQQTTHYGWIIFAAIAGIILAVTWRRLIESYKQLNTGKFRIIHQLETRLPVKLFTHEWDILNQGDGTVYKPFSHFEMQVPSVFALLYVVFIIALLIELC